MTAPSDRRADGKRRSDGLLGWLIDDIAVAINMKDCPYCRSKIRSDARKCPHCTEWLDRPIPSEAARPEAKTAGGFDARPPARALRGNRIADTIPPLRGGASAVTEASSKWPLKAGHFGLQYGAVSSSMEGVADRNSDCDFPKIVSDSTLHDLKEAEAHLVLRPAKVVIGGEERSLCKTYLGTALFAVFIKHDQFTHMLDGLIEKFDKENGKVEPRSYGGVEYLGLFHPEPKRISVDLPDERLRGFDRWPPSNSEAI